MLLFLGCASPSSDVEYAKVDDSDLVYLMNCLEIAGSVSSDELAVRVLTVPNPSGSAGFESGEVTHTVYIAVSEYDEAPKQSLFKLSDTYRPRVARAVVEGGTPAIYMNYGVASGTERVRIAVSVEELDIEHVPTR